MDLKALNEQVRNISTLINNEDYQHAYGMSLYSLDLLKGKDIPHDLATILISNIAGFLVDIGNYQPNVSAAQLGFNLLVENKDEILKYCRESDYYYNLANAKSNLVPVRKDGDKTFEDVEGLLVVKNYFWKSYHASLNEGGLQPELLVNLANSLNNQFRISESLNYYDKANFIDNDLPPLCINRSHSLEILNDISSLMSIKILVEIRKGYEKTVESEKSPASWKERFSKHVQYLDKRIIEANEGKEFNESTDVELNESELLSLNDYQKFCIERNLILSEHALYCKCIGASRDNLTILTPEGVFGDFIIPMEMALNRMKAEYALARKMYYDFLVDDSFIEEEDESCYSELFNNEVLNSRVEKLRTSFRMCFGILDKIAVAICEMYKIPSSSKSIYFHSFWNLNKEGRREFFEGIKSPGLLALYSIAADLNKHKDGELSFFREWRNDLEHKFLVIYRGDKTDIYNSYSFFKDIIFIEEGDFVNHFELLINITRSAIFSFVYTIRFEGKKPFGDDIVTMPNEIQRKLI